MIPRITDKSSGDKKEPKGSASKMMSEMLTGRLETRRRWP